MKTLEKKIKASPQLQQYKNPVTEVKESVRDIRELIEFSDHIVHVNVLEVTQINEFSASVIPKIISQYKSNQLYEKGVNVSIPTFELSEEVIAGNEYLLFQAYTPTVDGEALLPTTRYGSIISKQDSKRWEDALSLLVQ